MAQAMFATIGQTLKEIDGVVPIAIGGSDDHIHVLFSTKGLVGESEIMRKIKSESSLWINNNRLTRCRFAWQRGGARISYSYSAIKDVVAYIENQVEHHKHTSFRQEYESILRKLGKEVSEYDLPEDLI